MLRTRSFTLEVVPVAQRAASDAPAKAKVYKFRASDGEWDRYQDRLRVTGWKLDAFNANPVVLFNHDDGHGWTSRGLLPIGKARMFFEGDALMSEIEFDQDDPFAKQIESKVEKGILNAVSVRYRMHKFHENERGGYDSDEQELLELSVVTIPGNQRAVRAKGLEDQPVFPGATMTPEQIKAMQAENEAFKAAEAAKKALEAAEAKKAEQEALAKRVASEIIEQSKGNRDGFVAVMQRTATEGVQVGRRTAEGTGIELARFVKAKAVAAMTGRPMLDVLKGWGYADQAKALSSGDFAGGGSLIRPEYAADFIALLRNQTIVRKAGARQVPMGASLTFDGQASAATASYGGETDNIPTSNPTTSQPLKLTEKILTGLVAIPNDLIQHASISAEEFVRDDLARVMALKEDEKFLYGSGSSFEPLGITKQLHADHIYAMTALATASVPLVGEVKKELNKALKLLKKANIPMESFAWMLGPTNEAAILNAVGPGGEGANVLERELGEQGKLRGKPAHVSNQVTEGVSSADFLGFDMSQVIIGDSQNMEIEVFPNGTFHNGSAVVSGISTRQTVIRAVSKHDIGLRYSKAGIRVTGVTWGF